MSADARSARDEEVVRLVKYPHKPTREIGGDADWPVVALFRAGGGIPAEFEAYADDVVTLQVVDASGNVLASKPGKVSVELRPVHPGEGPPYWKRIQSIRFDRARGED